jgi:hypothetical protein
MRRFVASLSWPRIALGLVVPAVLTVTGGGSALAASGPAAATGAGRVSAAPACTVRWVGLASRPLWTTAKNWSTGKVPGPASDVCISTGVDVLTGVSITIHSLRLGKVAGIALEGTAANPLTATVATAVNLTPGAASRIDLTDATLNAAQINDQGGTIFTDGTCRLVSPDIVFGAGGNVQAANGKTTLTSLPQLSNGTLTGATFDTSGAVVVLPGDINHLVSANIGVGANSAIVDPAGRNALTGLTSIDSQSSLSDDSGLSLTGSLAASGNVSLGGKTLSVAGTFTQAQGTLSLSGNTALSASQVAIDQGASMQANAGTIAGSLVNDGSVRAFGPAATHVTGNYAQAPGASLDSGFGGPLAVAGTATLAGSVSSFQAFPVAGATSPVITFGSVSGSFTSNNLGFTLLTKAHEIDVVTQPQIAASPTTVAPGHTVTVNGASFRLGTVTIFLDHVSGTPLAQTIAGYGGRFAVTVTIPASAKAGSHKLITTQQDSNPAETTITVT